MCTLLSALQSLEYIRARQVGEGKTEWMKEGSGQIYHTALNYKCYLLHANESAVRCVLHIDHPTNAFNALCCDAADKWKLEPNLGSGSCWCHYAPSVWHPTDIINKNILSDVFLDVLLCLSFSFFLALDFIFFSPTVYASLENLKSGQKRVEEANVPSGKQIS